MRPAPSELLKAADVRALLVCDRANVRYLSGLDATTALLLVLPKGMLLFIDGRYTEVAAEAALPGVRVRDVARLEGFLEKVRVCGVESEHLTLARFAGWKRTFKRTRFVRTLGAVEGFRRTKDAEELRLLKRARRIAVELLRRVPSALRSRVTERELAWRLEAWARELGAEKLSFEPIVAFGTHTSRPHHRPTSRALKKGHLVQIDVGAVYRGYCSDVSEVFFTARRTPEQETVLRAVTEAKEKATRRARAGVTAGELDRTARAVLASYSLEEHFLHALGHGVGLEVHEGITISPRRKDERLLSGEVIAIEPGVYLPGRFGMRVEDMVFIP